MIKIHGVSLSPFVRKVLFVLEHKGLEFENLAVFPGSDDADFRKMSPLGKIPALEHGDFSIADSAVICRYIDGQSSEKSIYPTSPEDLAKAMWIEIFAGSKLVEALGGLFQQRFLRPKMLGEATDEVRVKELLEVEIPAALDYLETLVPESGVLVGDSISIADISVVTCFVQGQYADFELNGDKYPKTKRYLDMAMNTDLVKNRIAKEQEDMAKIRG